MIVHQVRGLSTEVFPVSFFRWTHVELMYGVASLGSEVGYRIPWGIWALYAPRLVEITITSTKKLEKSLGLSRISEHQVGWWTILSRQNPNQHASKIQHSKNGKKKEKSNKTSNATIAPENSEQERKEKENEKRKANAVCIKSGGCTNHEGANIERNVPDLSLGDFSKPRFGGPFILNIYCFFLFFAFFFFCAFAVIYPVRWVRGYILELRLVRSVYWEGMWSNNKGFDSWSDAYIPGQ